MSEEPPLTIKVEHKKQPHHHSLLEVFVHMVTGLLIGVLVIYFMFPGVPFMSNVTAGVVITAIKFVVNYFTRRYFANIERRTGND